MNPDNLHSLQHPSVPFTASAWSEEQKLHVACAISNPCRWRTRRQLMQDFRRHMEASANVVLHVGELAYGDRPFEVTQADHPLDYQFRTRHELWHKENLLNLIVSRFPAGWKYGAYIDGDFVFTRQDWALETVHLLQHYSWVQLFSNYTDLGRDHQPVRTGPGFASMYAAGNLEPKAMVAAYKGGYSSIVGQKTGAGGTGGAWAFRRDAFDDCGGFLDTCILGSADWHMAFGLAGLTDHHASTARDSGCGDAYVAAIADWQTRANLAVKKNIGTLNCLAVHHYHGPRIQRGYDWRWRILANNKFNPHTDIFRDSQGVYQLNPNKVKLRDEIRAYFRSRNEDL